MEMGNNLTKFIVYLTTNTINKKIYIGVHKTLFPYKFDGYLGCGIYENDRYSYQFNKNPLGKAVTKYGPSKFIRYTLKVFDTEQEALDFEKNLVTRDFINRSDTYNATIGGGMPPKCSKIIYQYTLLGEFIKEWSSITEASTFYKCSSSSIGQAIFDKTPSLGFLWTEFKKDKIDINLFKIGENKIKIYMYSSIGEYIESFSSIGDCARYFNVERSRVSNALHGKHLFDKKYYFSYNKYDKYPIIPQHSRNNVVYQYSLSGEFIKLWESLKIASKTLNINETCIATSINKETSAGNFLWRWEKYEFIKEFKSRTKARKVGKFTLNRELIQIFNTVSEAKKDCRSSLNALYRKQKTAGGYIWKFID